MDLPRLKAFVFTALSVSVGLWVAHAANAALKIEIRDKTLPAIAAPARTPATSPEALRPFDVIELPADAADDELYAAAAADLAAALAHRTGHTPTIVVADAERPRHEGQPTRIIRVDAGDGAGEGFRLVTTSEPPEFVVTVRGASRLAATYGIYRLAEELWSGLGEAALGDLDARHTPALEHRYVDPGAVGIVADADLWRAHDYSHHNRAFFEAILAEPPFVDEVAMAAAEEQLAAYLHRMIRYGYNGIILNARFLEYVNFDRVAGGYAIYGPDSAYRARHEALRAAFGRLIARADALGFRVLLKTDMLALTPPLADYFDRELGGVDADDPRLWEVYRAGLAELYEALPAVDGIVVRIGEAGAVYDLRDWDYSSQLAVTSATSVQAMLRTLTEVSADYRKQVVFRSWSVGVGEIGDMHTNPETLHRILAPLSSLANLVVSTKYTMGDFYSFLPLNPTLFVGEEARLVEFQARREFEAFNAFPNYLAPLHQVALQAFIRENPQLDGIWVWTQDGGPPRAGPWSLYPFHGLWQWIDDSVFATGRLSWEPDSDLDALTKAWVRRSLSVEPATVDALSELLLRSHEAVREGLYVRPYSERQVFALGLEPPPQMWIFEWDIVAGASAPLVVVYLGVGDAWEEAIAGGFRALAEVETMQGLVAEVDPKSLHDPGVYPQLVASLAYERDLFATLAWYRQAFLSYYRWLDTGERAARERWREGVARFEVAKAAHLERYGRDLDFPAYNFFAAEAGMAHARRNNAMVWGARGLLLVIALTFLAGAPAIQRRTPDYPGKIGHAALYTGLMFPWRVGEATSGAKAVDLLVCGAGPLVLLLLARLVFSSFLSATYLLIYGLTFAAFAVLAVTLARGRSRAPLLAAIAGTLLFKSAGLLAVLAIRGPGYYWFLFWTSEPWRNAYATLITVTGTWFLFAVYAALRVAYGRSVRAAWGAVLLMLGLPVALVSGLVCVVGLERSLTAVNDELALLPLGLSRILGLTTHLNIPAQLAVDTATFAAVLVALGLALNVRSQGAQPATLRGGSSQQSAPSAGPN